MLNEFFGWSRGQCVTLQCSLVLMPQNLLAMPLRRLKYICDLKSHRRLILQRILGFAFVYLCFKEVWLVQGAQDSGRSRSGYLAIFVQHLLLKCDVGILSKVLFDLG